MDKNKKMKPFIIVIIFLLFVILILTISLFWNSRQADTDKRELQRQSLIIEDIERQRDSLEFEMRAVRDSLGMAFIVLENAKRDKENAEKQALYEKIKYEKILFIRHHNDAARDSALSELYPSLHNR